ncbi:cwf18 pre-mRNA splicing factor-domain-containing protein [Podospora fimiseda]|uniref:Cwf18 pre-mRNA splicing factor-domain-containing protein n=1 Tax=Podospora fimiseda TaxID=252190 RepID=A0AAN7BM80_9PEZI|nr:cwf18 pre-mRNA splicing factor-domain-containing protein [Podospora fimiseda]
MSLSSAADERKARLAKLKSLKRKEAPTSDPTDNDDDNQPSPPSPPSSKSQEIPDVTTLHLSLRNYDPSTKGPKLGFEAPPILPNTITLEEQASEIQEQVNRQAAIDTQEAEKGIDLFKLQPKKPNWDLKRELNQKMEVLNVRTDNAIARMVRERLADKKKEPKKDQGDAEADGVLDGTAIVEGIKLREREEEEEARREKEAEEEEFADGTGNP